MQGLTPLELSVECRNGDAENDNRSIVVGSQHHNATDRIDVSFYMSTAPSSRRKGLSKLSLSARSVKTAHSRTTVKHCRRKTSSDRKATFYSFSNCSSMCRVSMG